MENSKSAVFQSEMVQFASNFLCKYPIHVPCVLLCTSNFRFGLGDFGSVWAVSVRSGPLRPIFRFGLPRPNRNRPKLYQENRKNA